MYSNSKLLIIGLLCFTLVGVISFKDKLFNGEVANPTVKKTIAPTPKGNEGHEHHKEKKTSMVRPMNDHKVPERKTFKNLKEKEEKIVVQFQDQRDDLIKHLPLVSDLQKLDDGEAHHITPGLLQTGKRLSRLKELVLKYPKVKPLQEEANEFYETCAGDSEFPTSIRSLCLFSRLQLAKNREESFDISPYPLEIKQMVMELAPSKK
jgi:hypothetical protein